MKLRLRVRLRASEFGRKPSSRATRRIRSRVSADMRPVSLRAFEAVAVLTCAAAATS